MKRRVSYRAAAHGRATQNKLTPSTANGELEGATIGVDGAIPTEEQGEMPGVDLTEPGESAIPAAGTGGAGKTGPEGGEIDDHALNLVAPTSAGRGTDAGSAGPKGGESPRSQDTVRPARSTKTPNPTGKLRQKTHALGGKGKTGSNRVKKGVATNLGHYLHRVGG